MKIKVLDLCTANNDVVEYNEEELFDIEIYQDEENPDTFEPENLSGWERYINAVNFGNLDDKYFDIDEVDKNVFIIDDGGELFKLKDGSYINVCWRGDMCRVWGEDGDERTDFFNQKLFNDKIEEDEEDYVVRFSYSNKDKKWKVEVLDQNNKVVESSSAISEEKAFIAAKKLAKKYKALRVYKQVI